MNINKINYEYREAISDILNIRNGENVDLKIIIENELKGDD